MNTARSRQNPNSVPIYLDDGHGAEMIRIAQMKSGADAGVFAELMGCTRDNLVRYLTGKKVPSPFAVRAAVLAAMLSGVPMHLPKPGRFTRSAQ